MSLQRRCGHETLDIDQCFNCWLSLNQNEDGPTVVPERFVIKPDDYLTELDLYEVEP